MYKLTPTQVETMRFCKKQIDEARKNENPKADQTTLDARNGIVYTQGGNCTMRTLKKLEQLGLIEVLEDNSGIGTGFGAFPSKVKVLNY